MHFTHVLSFASLCVLTSAILNPDWVDSQINNASVSVPGNDETPWNCFFPTKGMDPRGPAVDCIHAILQFPQTSEVGTYSRNGDAPPDKKMPYRSRRAGCEVKVDLRGNSPDRSSWSLLGSVATQLVFACGGAAGGTNAGGTMRTGNTGNLQITLGTSSVASDSNATYPETA